MPVIRTLLFSLWVALPTTFAVAQQSKAASAPASPAPSAKAAVKGAVAKKTTRRKRVSHADTAVTTPAPVWPVDAPDTLPGSILPAHRIVAFYGTPLSKRMGILGALPHQKMIAKLDTVVAQWNAADSTTPAIPALHFIAVVAQANPGKDGKYRLRMDSAMIEKVYGWAHEAHALLFLDIQVGKSTLRDELPPLARFLSRPDVHLAIDPEFSMKRGSVPGKVVGTFDASDVDYASDFLEDLVSKDSLPPKVLIVHRFRGPMLTHSERIILDPRVQIVIDMDGWGTPDIKRGSYRAFVYKHPVEYTGFKLFYHNDTKKGDKLMTPADVLALKPKPLYIQYQ